MDDEIVRRNTQQRQVVLEELKKLTSHPTAGELYEITRRRLPKISLGTVYRNLELLSQMGLVHKLETGGAEARFDGDLTEHHHVRCMRCGRVGDAHGAVADPVRQSTKSLGGYQIVGYRLEFIGICPACAAESDGDKTACDEAE